MGTGVGVNAYVSKSLGEGNRAEADRAAANGLFLALCTFVVFFLFGLFGVQAFMNSQTTDPLIRQYGNDYLAVCCLFSLGCMIQCMVEKLLSATGRSNYAMITQLVGALTNIVMDPILIFGLFGFPRMEAAGAAAAPWPGSSWGLSRGCTSTCAITTTSGSACRISGPRPVPSGASTRWASPPLP